MNKEKKKFYECMMKGIQQIEEGLADAKQEIQKIKKYQVETCPDEIEADKAAYEVIQKICIDSLFDVEPKGDA